MGLFGSYMEINSLENFERSFWIIDYLMKEF